VYSVLHLDLNEISQ